MINQAKAILAKLQIPLDHGDYLDIRKMLQGRDGYVGLFTKLHFVKETRLSSLYTLADTIATQPHLIPKNLIQFESYEKIQDEIEKNRIALEAKRIYDQFPSTQKTLIVFEEDKNLLYALSENKSNANFLRKIAVYKLRKTLLANITRFINSKDDGRREKVLQEVKGMRGVNIIHNSKRDNILIVRIFEYYQLTRIASDTSWCIAQDPSTFRSYVPNKDIKQVIIFLFNKDDADPLRKIGATFSIYSNQGNTYHTAHNIRDGHVSYDKLKEILASYKVDISILHVTKDEILDIDAHQVEQLLNAGFTTADLLQRKRTYKENDLNVFSKEEIDKYDLLNKTEINGITLFSKYSADEIKSRNLFKRVVRGTLSLDEIIKFDIEYLRKNYDLICTLLPKHSPSNRRSYGEGLTEIDFFNEHLKTKPKSAYDYRVGSRWSNDRYSAEKTIFKLRWYKVDSATFSKNELHTVLDDAYPNAEVFKFIFEGGWKFTKKEMYDFVKSTLSHGIFNSGELSLLTTLIECKKLIDPCMSEKADYRPGLLKYISSYAWYNHGCAGLLKEYEVKKINKFFKPKKLERFNQIQRGMNCAKELKDLVYTKYSKHIYNEKKLHDFYDKWNAYIQQSFSVTAPYKGGYFFKQDDQVLLSVLYCKINKLEELNHIPFVWRLGSGSFNDDGANFIVRVMTNEYKTNGGLNVELNKTERKKLYHWFSVFQCSTTNMLDDYEIKDFTLSTMYYIFSYDEDWVNYLDRIKNVKKKSDRHRFSYLKDVFNYLISIDESSFTNNNNKDDKNWVMKIDVNNIKRINDLMKVIKSWQYKPVELKKTIESIQYLYANNPSQSILRKYIVASFRMILPVEFKYRDRDSEGRGRWYGDYLSDKLAKTLYEI